MEKTEPSKSEPNHQPNNTNTDWREAELKECSEDWRHRDRLIWATLPVAATVGAVIVGVAYGQIPDDKLWIRLCILLIGVVLTLVMLISLIRHRMYQEGSEEQIQSLRKQLRIMGWDKNPRKHTPFNFRLWGITRSKKIDAELTSWAMSKSGFVWMVRGTLVVVAILVVLAAVTFGQLILLILKLILN
jgi:hypothetical protein